MLKMGANYQWIFVVLVQIFAKSWSESVDTEFVPQVSATCKAGHMSIRVGFNSSFYGAVHARDFRTPACMTHGDGGKMVNLDINLLAVRATPDFCGLHINN
ncbi:PREDICTED: uncharacterized protein LOC108569516, partial [Nicrophorus vespilloides]